MAKLIKSSITLPVFEAINIYIRRHLDEPVSGNTLLDNDWKALRDIYKFLDLLLQITLVLESSTSTLNTILPTIDFILE